MSSLPSSEEKQQRDVAILVTSVLIVSVCAIVYELLISTLSSYLLGSSVLHFSLTIGFFMFFMGVGSFLSKYAEKELLEKFVTIEIAIGLVGGLSGLLLYASFTFTEYYYLVALLVIAAISVLAGLEIPILTRIVREYSSLKDAIAHILAFDYLGALLASIIFPLLLLPYLGIMRTAFCVGMLNILVSWLALHHFRSRLRNWLSLLLFSLFSFLCLTAGFAYSFSITSFFEKFLYQDPVIYSAQSAYQRIILTKYKEDIRLFLNGSLQFSSLDEHRYHESLVHLPLSQERNRERILVLGGGDGMAVRELLKYPDVKKITLVDLDPDVLELAKTHPIFKNLNESALQNPRVEVVVEDAYKFIEEGGDLFSVILIDLPDPNDLSLGKLYSREFYSLLKKRLARGGVVVTQASSPFFARKPFWSIHYTLAEVFPNVYPYSLYIPSLGVWGFQMASERELNLADFTFDIETKFLTPAVAQQMFVFDNDSNQTPAEVNTLNNQVLVQYYDQSWREWSE